MMMNCNPRTSELIFEYIKRHGSTGAAELKMELGTCTPTVQFTLGQMTKANVLALTKRLYSIGSEPLFCTCRSCYEQKEVWRFKGDGRCAVCHLGDKGKSRAASGTQKHEQLYSEWNEAVAVNRIINLQRFTGVGVKSLVKELRACR
ncbi:hypothetical protein ACNZ70_001943 [Vibrio mimicus]